MATMEIGGAGGLGDGRLVFASGSSVIARWLGLCIGAAGVLMLWIGLGPEAAGREVAPLKYMGGVFLAVGLVMLLHVLRREIDRDRGLVEIVWGVGLPFGRKTLSLNTWRQVRIDVVRAPGGSGQSRRIYQVALGDDEKPGCVLWGSRRYEASRRRAEEVARFVGLPLADHTGGAVSVREPEALDRPVVERWRAEGSPRAWGALPAGSRLKVRREDGALVVSLPARGFTPPIALVAMTLPGSVIVPLMVLSSGVGMGAGVWIVAAFVAVPAAVCVAVISWCVGSRGEVRVDREGITVTRRLGGVRRSVYLPANELEEVVRREDAGLWSSGKRSGGLVLRSDQRTCVIGVSLSEEDRDWLADAIRVAMTG